MFSFTQLFALASVVVAVNAGSCTNKSVVSSSDFGHGVTLTTFQCETQTKRSELTVRQATDVCNAICNISCDSAAAGLPPVIDDCERIVNAVKILESVNDIPLEFTVDTKQRQALTFQTCTIFFDNQSDGPLTSCWSAMTTQASAAGAACFPPNQPIVSEGDCLAADSTWVVGAEHSDPN